MFVYLVVLHLFMVSLCVRLCLFALCVYIGVFAAKVLSDLKRGFLDLLVVYLLVLFYDAAG